MKTPATTKTSSNLGARGDSVLSVAGPLAGIRSSYLVCGTPRCGSTLLCEALARTGIGGHPEEYFQSLRSTGAPRRPREYFADPPPRAWRRAAAAPDPPDPHHPDWPRQWHTSAADYVTWVAGSATPNRILGAKVMWGYFADFISLLRELPGGAHPSSGELVRAVFPDVRFVWMTRQDKLRQAVSLWKSIQTDRWRSARDSADRPPTKELRFDFDAIADLSTQLVEHDTAWGRWFHENRLDPLVVAYEPFVGQYEKTLATVIRHIGAEPPDALPPPPLARQADRLSEQWVERFRAEERASASFGETLLR